MFFLPYLRKLDNGMKNGFDNPPHICLEGYFFERMTQRILFESFSVRAREKYAFLSHTGIIF